MSQTNQILVYEKIIVTPELKRKKKFYKLEFVISLFLLCTLFSYYIYAEYDRNKSEGVSKEILGAINIKDNTTVAKKKNEVTIVYLNNTDPGVETETQVVEEEVIPELEAQVRQNIFTHNGVDYETVGIINIPKIDVNYPILANESEELLKVAPCKYWGPEVNQVGNLCIVGHNYRNNKFFSKVPTLENGDTIEITDLSGKVVTYVVYDKYNVDPRDTSCTTQKTKGKTEITLITCTNDSSARVVVKAKAIK